MQSDAVNAVIKLPPWRQGKSLNFHPASLKLDSDKDVPVDLFIPDRVTQECSYTTMKES